MNSNGQIKSRKMCDRWIYQLSGSWAADPLQQILSNALAGPIRLKVDSHSYAAVWRRISEGTALPQQRDDCLLCIKQAATQHTSSIKPNYMSYNKACQHAHRPTYNSQCGVHMMKQSCPTHNTGGLRATTIANALRKRNQVDPPPPAHTFANCQARPEPEHTNNEPKGTNDYALPIGY